jgi:hypothetical protein
MSKISDDILNTAYKHFEFERDKAITNLKILTENPTSIPEHPDMIKDVVELVSKAADAVDGIEMLDKIKGKQHDKN